MTDAKTAPRTAPKEITVDVVQDGRVVFAIRDAISSTTVLFTADEAEQIGDGFLKAAKSARVAALGIVIAPALPNGGRPG